MKKKSRYNVINALLLLVAIVVVCQLSSCKKDNPTAQEIIKAKLIASTWKMQSVFVDGKDQTSVYAGLTLTITEGNFSTTNGGVVWPASGTWTFISEDGTKVKRDDDTEIGVEVTDTSLKLTLDWATTTIGTGRSQSVQGRHVFTFTE